MISQVTTIPRGSRLVLRLGSTSGTIGSVKLTMPVLRKPVSG
jgi:hypothetical protein